jgi:hypothetical protein
LTGTTIRMAGFGTLSYIHFNRERYDWKNHYPTTG